MVGLFTFFLGGKIHFCETIGVAYFRRKEALGRLCHCLLTGKGVAAKSIFHGHSVSTFPSRHNEVAESCVGQCHGKVPSKSTFSTVKTTHFCGLSTCICFTISICFWAEHLLRSVDPVWEYSKLNVVLCGHFEEIYTSTEFLVSTSSFFPPENTSICPNLRNERSLLWSHQQSHSFDLWVKNIACFW